jgi:hypothetical protein
MPHGKKKSENKIFIENILVIRYFVNATIIIITCSKNPMATKYESRVWLIDKAIGNIITIKRCDVLMHQSSKRLIT